MRHFPADATAHAAVIDMRDCIATQAIIAGLECERRATRQPNAGMVAGAKVVIDAKTLAHDALAFLRLLLEKRRDAALPRKLTFAFGHDHFGSGEAGGESLSKRRHRGAHIVSAHRPYPFDTDPANGGLDRVLAIAAFDLAAG